MPPKTLTTTTTAHTVWRVGYSPDPWAWSGWQYATDGRFPGRWDDIDGNFRTIYAGSSLLACLLEVLAHFRQDAHLAAEFEDIDEDDLDRHMHPTIRPGRVPRQWLDLRGIATGTLTGTFCVVTASETIARLHPGFIGLALSLGLSNFDAAALKDARPRRLTQSIATWLYENTDVNGVSFKSRHGDDLSLWAVFERPQDGPVSACLTDIEHHMITGAEPEFVRALHLLDLQWD
ncbi:RES family NAD+ phosphorylase (plasmid) [Arthrobacter agilis]|uniref:RES family NAD+ phosphorylase n=1 Tax=Arthrobacter agilis TaxID=37921 RepID=UPI002365D1FB|nr:RES family NAD+ phosphorylase [Arthrobacter agilis]WDF35242.1 RES family NAD+ phosphorylase [Arthrobacter agilis]